MTRTIDLVADVGEAFGAYSLGDDDLLLDALTSANVACGFHAGDPQVMEKTVASCTAKGVSVGAHPGFHDLEGFGRRPISMSQNEVRVETLYQIGALQAMAKAHGVKVSHVTPHGSLGNLSVTDKNYAAGIVQAVLDLDTSLPVVTQEGELARAARSAGIPVAITAMVDRAYNSDGSLVSRKTSGAVIHDVDEMVERTVRMVTEGTVKAHDGTVIDIDVDTVLLHGDSKEALETSRLIREALAAEDIKFAPMASVISAKKEQP